MASSILSEQAVGLEWLKLFMNGASIRKIARIYKRDWQTVNRIMSVAAEKLLEESKEQVIKELLPLAIKVYQAAMQQQIAAADGDKSPAHEINTKHADRILKGMFIIDHAPTPKQQMLDNPNEEASETLAAFMVKRPAKQIAKAAQAPVAEIAAEAETTIDGEVNADEQ